ncbi:MAG: XdhC family protein [Bacteroidia bacterium]|nr:XdhC family protein [Bacteroidia bacterium]
MSGFFAILAQLEAAGTDFALCTVTDSHGSTPRKPGAKMAVLADGTIFGSIGGGALEFQVIRDAQKVLHKRKAQRFTHALVQDHGMCCGGSIEIFIEPIMAKKQLFIFGAGHIGRALAEFASRLDFAVTVIDERSEQTALLQAEGLRLLNMSHLVAFEELNFTPDCLVCVITHDHAYDREIVAHCARQPHAYLGMIGSQRKVEMAKKIFLAANTLTEEEMAGIDWPMGLPIRSQTPAEIAISILARLIDVRGALEPDLAHRFRKEF